MDSTEKRLIGIFENVFPDVAPEEIPAASQNSIENWDSVAAITLMNLIEEEFGIEMDFGELGELTSFVRVLQYLEERTAHTAR